MSQQQSESRLIAAAELTKPHLQQLQAAATDEAQEHFEAGRWFRMELCQSVYNSAQMLMEDLDTAIRTLASPLPKPEKRRKRP